MEQPTEQELKSFCQSAGVEFHEVKHLGKVANHRAIENPTCSCGKDFFWESALREHIKNSNPDFSDPREVLKVAMKKDNFDEFIVENGSLSKYGKHLDTILIDLITEPYALFWAYYEWLKNDKKI